jgi:uncharacterized protein (TIGR02001 family)
MRGKTFTSIFAAAFALAAGAAAAADMPVVTKAPPLVGKAPISPIFQFAFGASVSTDYNFRGVSQSDRDWSFGGYLEGRYNSPMGQWYLGLAGWRVDWPTSYGFSDPSAEIDVIVGWRHTWDKTSVDIGAIYYYYPSESFGIDSDFFEIYWKGAYAISDRASVGLNVFYSPDLLNYGDLLGGDVRSIYASLTGSYKFWTQGDWSGLVSGELGHWWIKDTGFASDPDYTYWNAGIAWSYKTVTLDLRYHDTNQSRADCASFLLTTTGNPAARWCRDAYIATLKFDMVLPN